MQRKWFIWLMQIDVNTDGLVDFTEFVAATLHVHQLEEHDSAKWHQRSQAAFEKFDIDKDGFITPEELRMVCFNFSLSLFLVWCSCSSLKFPLLNCWLFKMNWWPSLSLLGRPQSMAVFKPYTYFLRHTLIPMTEFFASDFVTCYILLDLLHQ